MGFDQKEFNEFVVENNVVGFFKEPIKLKSGRMSNWYVNWRDAAGDAFLLDALAEFVISFAGEKGLSQNCFYGVPEGATKIGVITQYKFAKSSGNFARVSRRLSLSFWRYM